MKTKWITMIYQRLTAAFHVQNVCLYENSTDLKNIITHIGEPGLFFDLFTRSTILSVDVSLRILRSVGFFQTLRNSKGIDET